MTPPPVYRASQQHRPLAAAPSTPPSRTLQRHSFVTHQPLMVQGGGRRIIMRAAGVSEPVGSVEIRPGSSSNTEIVNLNVAPQFRRQGIARQLVSAAIQAAGGPAVGITLEAQPAPGTIQRSALISMYQKMGFQISGQSTRGNPVMALNQPGRPPASLQRSSRAVAVAQQKPVVQRSPAPPAYRPAFSSVTPPPAFRATGLAMQAPLSQQPQGLPSFVQRATPPRFAMPPALQLHPASAVRPPAALSGWPNASAIQRMQTGREVTPVPSFGFDDQQGNTIPSHHHNTMEQFVTTYRVAESGHTNWDTQKQFSSHRNRCAACIGIYAEDATGQGYIFSRDVIYDGCANLYSSGDGKETKALMRPEIREVSHDTGGNIDLNQTRREFKSPQLTAYESNIGGYSVKVNVVDPAIVKANLMALNAWGMNKTNKGGSNTKYSAASHHHSEQVIVIALQGSDVAISLWLKGLINAHPNMDWIDYQIMVHSERQMCANCAKAFNSYIEHPAANYIKTWALIKQHFTYVPTASFQVSSRVTFNQNPTQPATTASPHGQQTFVTPPSHNLAQNVTFPTSMDMDDIYQ